MVGEDPIDIIGMSAHDPVVQELVEKHTEKEQSENLGR